jgi:hypothetical protein
LYDIFVLHDAGMSELLGSDGRGKYREIINRKGALFVTIVGYYLTFWREKFIMVIEF